MTTCSYLLSPLSLRGPAGWRQLTPTRGFCYQYSSVDWYSQAVSFHSVGRQRQSVRIAWFLLPGSAIFLLVQSSLLLSSYLQDLQLQKAFLRRFCCIVLASLLWIAAIRRILSASCQYSFSRRKSLRTSPRFRLRSYFHVAKYDDFDPWRGASVFLLRGCFFCGVSFNKVSPRTPWLEKTFSTGPKCHVTFIKRGFSSV